jgi:hypothetical protein
MDDNNQQTGQQGYGQNEDPTKSQSQQPSTHERNAQPIGGNDSGGGTGTTMTSGSSTADAGADVADTGQASYGNSGQAGAAQGLDRQNGQPGGDQGTSGGFIGSGASGNDMGSSGPSDMQSASSELDDLSSSDTSLTSSLQQQDGSAEQDFAEQGQGALDDTSMNSDQSTAPQNGTDDIEVERSQGREQGIDQSSM